jgi:hypothetical protein
VLGQDVKFVEQHDVDAALERLRVGLDVGLDRRGGEERALAALDRNIDQRKGIHRLRLPVLEQLEIFLLQIADEAAVLIGDERVDLDVIDLDLEGRPLRTLGTLRRRRGWSRGLAGSQHRASQDHSKPNETEMSIHMYFSRSRVALTRWHAFLGL